jgi:glycine/D-amino acid oxidase-like deaminating enzyme
MKNLNYWVNNTPRPEGIISEEMPSTVDVAIVGSGYTGLNAAIELVKNGASVAVLDQGTLGFGGSSRNGGIFSPDLKSGMQSIENRYGMETAKVFWQWSLDASQYVENTISSEGIVCDYQQDGQVYLAIKAEHFTAAQRYMDYLAKNFGYTGQRAIGPSEIRDEIGSDSFYAGIFEAFAGGVDPAKYVFGLAKLAAMHGAQLIEHAKVTKVERLNSGFHLIASKGHIQADEVLLATNGYTTHLVPQARFGIFPIASCIILTEPLPESLQREISPSNRVYYDSKRLLNYFRLTADGRLLFGGRKSTAENTNLERSARRIHRRMLQVFPQLLGVCVTHTWSGYVGYTFDHMPHIGRINGIHYAYGYCGHGVIASSYMGVEVAKLISGEKESSPFLEIDHPRFFGASFEKIFLPLGSVWFRFLDRYT